MQTIVDEAHHFDTAKTTVELIVEPPKASPELAHARGQALLAAVHTLEGHGHRRIVPDTQEEHLQDVLHLAERYLTWILSGEHPAEEPEA